MHTMSAQRYRNSIIKTIVFHQLISQLVTPKHHSLQTGIEIGEINLNLKSKYFFTQTKIVILQRSYNLISDNSILSTTHFVDS